MARGYDDVHRLADLSDDELAELIRQQFEDTPELDPELIDIEVRNGFVRLTGVVGSEQELYQAEATVADVLGISSYVNRLEIDPLLRGTRSEAADEEAAQARESAPQVLGAPERSSSEADHLVEDLEGDQFGSPDVHRALSRGQTYEPPTRPVQEGSSHEDH